MACLRQAVNRLPINLASIGEAEQRVVGVHDPDRLDEILFFHRGRAASATAAALRPVVGDRLHLDVADVGKGDDDVLRWNEIEGIEFLLAGLDLRTPLIAELALEPLKLFPNHAEQTRGLAQGRNQSADGLDQAAVLLAELLLLEAGQAV